jgi:hypothetical protein
MCHYLSVLLTSNKNKTDKEKKEKMEKKKMRRERTGPFSHYRPVESI